MEVESGTTGRPKQATEVSSTSDSSTTTTSSVSSFHSYELVEKPLGSLSIKVYKGRNLGVAAYHEPRVVVKYGDASEETPVAPESSEPVWNFIVSFPHSPTVHEAELILKHNVVVYQKTSESHAPATLGTLRVSVTDGFAPQWVPIRNNAGVECGRLKVGCRIKTVQSSESARAKLRQKHDPTGIMGSAPETKENKVANGHRDVSRSDRPPVREDTRRRPSSTAPTAMQPAEGVRDVRDIFNVSDDSFPTYTLQYSDDGAELPTYTPSFDGIPAWSYAAVSAPGGQYSAISNYPPRYI